MEVDNARLYPPAEWQRTVSGDDASRSLRSIDMHGPMGLLQTASAISSKSIPGFHGDSPYGIEACIKRKVF